MEIKIPYGMSYKQFEISKDRVKGFLCSRLDEYETIEDQGKIVKNALVNPIASTRLKDLAKEVDRLLLITSDHTRPVPSKMTLPLLLQEIRSENPGIEIKILIATGFHRPTTKQEMIHKFGKEIFEKETILNHDSRNRDAMVFKGILPSGGELYLNALVDWADLVISEGFIEPHFFAGFSGGRKSILPGIADEKTIFANHCSKFISSQYARTGNILRNPIHADMLFAAKKAKLAFILNVVINSKKSILHAFAGDPIEAHKKGYEFLRNLTEVKAVHADIVITTNGGYPLDQNIYQAVKGMTAAERCVNEGGIIIMVAACSEGHGGIGFYQWFTQAASPRDVVEKIEGISQDKTVADQWEAQILARVLVKNKVIMVTDNCSRELVENMHMTYAASLEQALAIAEKELGENADVVVIPDGVGIIVN